MDLGLGGRAVLMTGQELAVDGGQTAGVAY